MKKKILATSIMFSTLVLGSNVFVGSTTKVLAIDTEISVKKDKGIIQNKIRFIEDDGAFVETDKGFTITNYSGKEGEEIQLEIPSGYELSNPSQKYYFESDDSVQEVKLKPIIIQNTINFINATNVLVNVGSINIIGKTNSSYVVTKKDVPKGYYLEYGDQHIVFSALRKTYNVYVTDIEKVKNTLIFINEEGKEVKRKDINGNLGSREDISNIFFEYNEYKLSEDQPKSIVFKPNNTEIKIKVTDQRKSNTLIFKSKSGKIISKKIIYGGVGRYIDHSKYLPEGYIFADLFNTNVKLDKDKDVKEYQVYKKSVKNELVFKDSKGTIINKKEVTGTENQKFYIKEYLLDGYDLDSKQAGYLLLAEDGSTIEVKVIKTYAKNLVIYKDSNGKILKSEEIKGWIGELFYADEHAPKGYRTKNNATFVIDDKGTKFEFTVMDDKESGYFGNYIDYFDESGIKINREWIGGRYNDEIDIEGLKGYNLLSDTKVRIKAEEGYIHKVKVKALLVQNKITLVDRFTGEKIGTFEITNLTGSLITNKDIPQKYNVSFVYQPKISAEYLSPQFPVQRIVNTSINYVDSKGTIIDKQMKKTLDRDAIKLDVPKGYKQATGNGYIFADYRSDIYNILIVPINSSNQSSATKPHLNPNQTVKPKPVNKENLSTQVNFLDKTTKKIIHATVVQGKHGQTVEMKVPEGYVLSDKLNDKLTLDKSKKSVDIYVTKKNLVGVSTDYSTVVLTKASMTSLFDKNGKQINNRALDFNSSWKANQKMLLNGVLYYRVATNEYVKANDVAEYIQLSSKIQTKTGSVKYLFDINGKQNKNRALAANTAWFTDRSATINGEKMYRVATNEWVKASDIK